MGTSKICIKINGLTYKNDDGSVRYYYIENGVVDFSDIDVSIYRNIANVTLVSGPNYLYQTSRLTTTDIETS